MCHDTRRLNVVNDGKQCMPAKIKIARIMIILGVVHNCQHLPISTESTNLGGGGGGEGASVLFFKC